MSAPHGHHYERGNLVRNRMNPRRVQLIEDIKHYVLEGNQAKALEANQDFLQLRSGSGRGRCLS